MSFNRINNILGWIICIIACSVYIMTMEATGSLWDCGEFASSAFKLQIPHPPGAPLFVLLGRLFTLPFASHPITGLNLLSALASGFTILFLFWTITHFGRKLAEKSGPVNSEKTLLIMAAGVIGSLAYTFSDSFWYSAVESEVYALSSFFTAIVFWAMLKWEQSVSREQAAGINGHFTASDRWIILIFYLMGLSIGVHLLNLLTIPALVIIYYFKRYEVTKWGTFFAFVIGCLITGLVQKAVIQWTIKGAGNLDIVFVNDFGLPMFTGFAFFFILLAGLIVWLLSLAKKNNWNFLKLGVWCFSFMLLGYSTYFTTMIRSNADPVIDMFNVDNPVSLVGYVSREQYGDWPILYGQDFTAQIQDAKITETEIKSGSRYEKTGRKVEYVYAPEDKHFFPRMWDQSNDQGHADYYASWAGIGKDPQTGQWERAPTMAENIGFFFEYQVKWMYMRYFFWNFVGKENDIQGINIGNPRDGNWMFMNKNIEQIDSLKGNKASNKLYALPLLLGLLGLFYQLKKDRRDALVTGLLFFFTGLAIVLYLNQAGNQPRERDYAYVGSFYAFAIWIGLGVMYVRDVFASFIKNHMAAGAVAALLCFALVPLNMGREEWDDHDRSKKTTALDLATNYLESCAPNAILISFGDNDTYPLWYAQEVEGIRRDVRVINSSLLGTDWYINQLRYKLNESDPIDPLWTPSQIEGSSRDVVYYAAKPGIDPNQFMNLYDMMKDYAGSDDPARMEQSRDGSFINSFPSKKVFVPVDTALVRRNGTANANDVVLPELRFEIPKNYIYKNDAAILNMIAANNWKRPICFTSPYGELGFQDYLRQDGMVYRLVPVAGSPVNLDWVAEKLKKFKFCGANTPGVFFDEENRRHLNSIRLAYAQAASALADANRKEEARELLSLCDKNMLPENFPIAMPSRSQQHNQISMQFLLASYKAGDSILANKFSAALKKDMEQQAAYYQTVSSETLSYDEERNRGLLQGIDQLKQEFGNKDALPPVPPMVPVADCTKMPQPVPAGK